VYTQHKQYSDWFRYGLRVKPLLTLLQHFVDLMPISIWYSNGSEKSTNKSVFYSSDTIGAVRCFQSSISECDKITSCFSRRGRCMPREVSMWWDSESSKFNARSDGAIWELTKIIGTWGSVITDRNGNKKDILKYVCALKSVQHPNTFVILFPIGMKQLPGNELLQEILKYCMELIYDRSCKYLLLCGHSMGAIWAQKTAQMLSISDISLDKIYVIGTGASKWIQRETSIGYIYRHRWLFFANILGEYIDSSIYSKVTPKSYFIPCIAMQPNGKPFLLTESVAKGKKKLKELHDWKFYHENITKLLEKPGRHILHTI
jgi:hypothetical protein